MIRKITTNSQFFNAKIILFDMQSSREEIFFCNKVKELVIDFFNFIYIKVGKYHELQTLLELLSSTWILF